MLLKVLNILGYLSLISLIFFLGLFIFSFDTILKILNIIILIAILLCNFFFFKKKGYFGIRILLNIITIFVLSLITYFSYIHIIGNNFKNSLDAIYDKDNNIIVSLNSIHNYNVTYIPDKLYIDSVSKGDINKGFIKFSNSDKYEEIIYSYTLSSFVTRHEHFTIIYNSNRYSFD